LRDQWEDARDPLAALRDGDPTLYAQFVEAETVSLLGFFRRLGAGAEEAEDLTQDTLLKLYRSAARYQPRERFRSFCFRVARNAWIDAERRRSVRPEAAAGQADGEEGPELRIPSELPGPERQSDAEEQIRRLAAGLDALSPAHRAVFELGAIQELGYAEVASILSIPEGTVKSRMFHAVRKLREHLDPQGDEVGSLPNAGAARPHAPETGR
jgi:RNA polymerase sigma-70 factor (ECF subfamily)